jgi:hypothetical protein
MDERREFTRIVRPLEVDVLSDHPIAGMTRDLSMNGLYVAAKFQLKVGTLVTCTLYVDGREGTVRITASGVVSRSTGDGMAVEFRELEGVDSFEHLQRLLLLNAGSQAERVEREFADHLGLKPR